jgi:hypothetical protein
MIEFLSDYTGWKIVYLTYELVTSIIKIANSFFSESLILIE